MLSLLNQMHIGHYIYNKGNTVFVMDKKREISMRIHERITFFYS